MKLIKLSFLRRFKDRVLKCLPLASAKNRSSFGEGRGKGMVQTIPCVEMEDLVTGSQPRSSQPYGLQKSNNEEKQAAMMECSLGEETGSNDAVEALPEGGEVVGPIALSSFESANSSSEFGVRREGVAKTLGRKRICWLHGIHRVLKVNRIRRQHGIRRWPCGQNTSRQFWPTSRRLEDAMKSHCGKLPIVDCCVEMQDNLTTIQPLNLNELPNPNNKVWTKTWTKMWCSSPPSMGEMSMCSPPLVRAGFGRAQLGDCVGGDESNSIASHSENKNTRDASFYSEGISSTSLSLMCSPLLVRALFARAEIGDCVGGDESCSIASHSENKNTRDASFYSEGINSTRSCSLEKLQEHFGRKREYAAKSLGVSVSTFKRICRHHGIKRWPYRTCRIRNKALKLSDPHGQENVSPTCFPPDSIGGHGLLEDDENMAILEWTNTFASAIEASQETPTSLDPSPSQPTRSIPPSVTLKPIYGRSIMKFQFPLTSGINELKKSWRLCWPYIYMGEHIYERTYIWAYIFRHAQLGDCVGGDESDSIAFHSENKNTRDASFYSEGISSTSLSPMCSPLSARDLFAHAEIGDCVGGVESGSIASHSENKNTIDASFYSEGISSTRSCSLEKLQERFGRKREDAAKSLGVSVSTLKRICRRHGIERWPYPTCRIRNKALKPFDPHGQENVSPTCFPPYSIGGHGLLEDDENMAISEYWRNMFTSATKDFQETPTSFDPSPSQSTRSIPPSVTLKPIYGHTIIRFQFPLTSGINELKEEVSKRLKLDHDSFDVKYVDEDGDYILIGCDEDLRGYLQLFRSLDNPVIRLFVVDKDSQLFVKAADH